MKLPLVLLANTALGLGILATVVWIFITDPQGDLRPMPWAEALAGHHPIRAPRTITARDGTECKLWPLEREYATTDPVFFWLCPGAGQNGRDRWGLAWNFHDVNARKGD